MKPEIEQEQTERTETRWALRKQIQPDLEQPRKEFDVEKLKVLGESMKAMGQQVPLLVQELANAKNGEKYQIIFGERRWRAAGLVDIERLKIEVADTSAPDWEKRKLALQVTENQCRENLTALEEAAALAQECKEDNAGDVAKRHGMSRASLFGRLRLLELTEPAKKALLAGEITPSVAGLVAMVDLAGQAKFLKEVLGDENWHGPMSFRRAQESLERNYARQLKNAPFDISMCYPASGSMVKAKNGEKLSASCGACPKRSGNMEGCGLTNPNVCTEPKCFEAKTRAAGELKVAQAESAGRAVIKGKEGAKMFSEYGDEDVNHGSGFVELDKRADLLGWDYKNHYRAALGKDLEGLAITVAVDRNGVARELVKRADAEQALKDSGKLKPAKKSKQELEWQEERRKSQAAEKVRRTECDAIMAAVVEKIHAMPVKELQAEWLWRIAGEGLSDFAGFYVQEPVRKRRGWEKGTYGDSLGEHLAEMKDARMMAAVIVELCCHRGEDLCNQVCKELKVDQKKIAKEAREALKKPKPKAAAKTKTVTVAPLIQQKKGKKK